MKTQMKVSDNRHFYLFYLYFILFISYHERRINMDFMSRCMVCHDATHFNTKLHDAQRIARTLERAIDKYSNNSDLEEYNKPDARGLFSFDHQHQHFMCGSCHKVNEHELRRYESEIDSALLKICTLITEQKIDNGEIHQCLSLLGGHYPGKYRDLEKFYYTHTKNDA